MSCSSSSKADSSPVKHAFDCPISLESMTTEDATVISCGHHFSRQGLYSYLNPIFGGKISTITDLFSESFQEKLQTTVVNCPVCAKRIRSVSDDAQYRKAIGTIEMLSSIAMPSSAASSSSSAPSAVIVTPVVSRPIKVHVHSLLTGTKHTYDISRSDRVARIWKKIIDNQEFPQDWICTLVNNKAILPWEPVSTYVSGDKNELDVHLIPRRRPPEFIADLARSDLGPTASENAIFQLSVSFYNKAIDATMKKLDVRE